MIVEEMHSMHICGLFTRPQRLERKEEITYEFICGLYFIWSHTLEYTSVIVSVVPHLGTCSSIDFIARRLSISAART